MKEDLIGKGTKYLLTLFRSKCPGRFLTAKITIHETDVYVTCCHLDHANEEQRMVDVGRMEHDLRDLFLNNEYQFWAGDFNSLTRRDYSEADWEAVALARSEDNWEAPKIEVTSHMSELGFCDLRTKGVNKGPLSTCRQS